MSLSTEAAIAIIAAAFALLGSAAAFLYGWVNVTPLRGIIEELKSDIKARKERERIFEARHSRYLKRLVYLMEGIRVLIEQLERLKEKPCWTPEEWDPDEEPEKKEDAE